MVGIGTKSLVADNTGALVVRSFNILKSHRFFSKIGDILVVSVKKAKPRKKVKKHDVRLSLLIRSRFKLYRPFGYSIYSIHNVVVLLDKKKNPSFTRVFGLVPLELRKHKYVKVILLSKGMY